jgi:hypothetical protein
VVSLHPCPDLGGEFFPHAAQAIKVVRRRRALGSKKWTTVTVYAITSLTALQADPTLTAVKHQASVSARGFRHPRATGTVRYLFRLGQEDNCGAVARLPGRSHPDRG